MNPGIYRLLLGIFGLFAIAAFGVLWVVPAPYGRFLKRRWGPVLDSRTGWLLMETPAALVFGLLFLTWQGSVQPAPLIFFFLWEAHYLQRAFVYPFLLRRNRNLPLVVVAMGFVFNLVNGTLQAGWIARMAPAGFYGTGWLTDWRFITGTALFGMGYGINRWSDRKLRRLRSPGEKEYRIPRGGLYRHISCPNYLGEIIQWSGWALATWSPAGLAFALWTVANLLPRAVSHHRWYRRHFPDYPPDRKALIPFIL